MSTPSSTHLSTGANADAPSTRTRDDRVIHRIHTPYEDGVIQRDTSEIDLTARAEQLTLEEHSTGNEQWVVQQGLRPGRHLTIQERFEEWLATPDGVTVYHELVLRAKRLQQAGWRHYSHKAIVESIRYDRNIHVGPEAGFKINDHYTSRLARLVMEENFELDGFFEIRELRA